MNLEHHINWAIYNYPTLYRRHTHAQSRHNVLGHLFLSIGTGYEWHPQGYLHDPHAPTPQIQEQLPENYYTHNLYSTTTTPDQLQAALPQLTQEHRYHYIIHENQRTAHGRNIQLVYAAKNDEDAIPIQQTYDTHEPKFKYAHHAHSDGYTPYPLSEYSPLVEILNGHTNSLHQDNFPLTPQSDWLQGCTEIAHEALQFYRDPERTQQHCYYWERTFRQLQWDEKEGNRNPWRKNLQPGETPVQYAQRIWHDYKQAQIKILTQYLTKYA